MSKFTPGPWQMFRSHDIYTDEAGNEYITRLCGVESVQGETVVSDEYGCKEADMRLIAAAPEMIEALKNAEKDIERLVKYIKDNCASYREDSTDEAPLDFEPTYIYKVIAKAEGKS